MPLCSIGTVTAYVRTCVPPSHETVQSSQPVPQPPSQLIGHAWVLQSRVSDGGHAAPGATRGVLAVYDRDCVPVAQAAEQEPQLPKVLAQSTPQAVVPVQPVAVSSISPSSRVAEFSVQALPPGVAGVVTAYVRLLLHVHALPGGEHAP